MGAVGVTRWKGSYCIAYMYLLTDGLLDGWTGGQTDGLLD